MDITHTTVPGIGTSITATPGKETTSPSSSPVPAGEPCFFTTEPTPTLRRTP